MASLFKWFSGGDSNDKNGNHVADNEEEADEGTVSPEYKERLHRCAVLLLAKDSPIRGGDLVVLKDEFCGHKSLPLRAMFEHGPVYVVHVTCVNDKLSQSQRPFYGFGQVHDAAIAYSDGVGILHTVCDARLLRSISNSEREEEIAIDPVLRAFIDDGVNVFDCVVGSEVRFRGGSCVYATINQDKRLRLDFAVVISRKSTPYNADTTAVPCLDDVTVLTGCDEIEPMLITLAAYNLCRIAAPSSAYYLPGDDNLV